MLDKITTSIKAIKDIADRINNQELLERIADLRDKILELREENFSLKEKLSSKDKYNMYFEDNMYFNILENENKEGPYCSKCWDSEKKAIRLFVRKNGESIFCPNCNTSVCISPVPSRGRRTF